MTTEMQTRSIARILIIRLSSIGDVLLTTPAIRLLKKKFPGSRIDFVVKNEFAELLIYNSHLDQFYLFDKNDNYKALKEIKQEIRNENYDLIVDLHNNFRSLYLTTGSRAPKIVRYKKGYLRRFLLVKFKLNFYKKNIPVYQRYINSLASFQINDDFHGLEIYIDKETENRILKKYADFLNGPKSLLVGIALGAKHATKRWTSEGFSTIINELIEKRNAIIILVGSRNDREMVHSLHIKENQSVLDATGELSLLESGTLMNQCDLMITHDSGLMHLSSALRKKTVAIFGSTTEELGFFPYTTRHIIVQNKDINCRPCSHIGRKKCPRGHFKCMKEITAEQVLKAVEKLLNSN
jgi:lipopolysaccharide heptosyltransferase II